MTGTEANRKDQASRGLAQPYLGHALLGGLLLLSAALQYPALSGPLLFDDHSSLGRLLTDTRGLRALLDDYLVTHSGPTGRPVAMTTFILNAWVNGADLWAWKLTNLLIHLLNGFLLYLVTRTVVAHFPTRAGQPGLIPAVVAGLWLIHPLHVSTVFYTVQRMTELALLFQALGLLGYFAARAHWVARRRGTLPYLLAAGGCLVLATLAKENGVLLLIYVLVFELVLQQRNGLAMRDAAWARAAVIGLTSACVLAGAYIAFTLDRIVAGYTVRPFTLIERLLTEARVVVDYIALTLVPRLDAMSFFHDDIALSTGLLAPPTTLAALLALATLAAAAWWSRRKVPLFALGIGWFFAGHLLESTLIPLHLMYEHRQYFPAFGLLLAAVGLFAALPIRPAIRALTATGFIGLCALMLVQRAAAWGNEWTLYESLLAANPASPGIAIVAGNRLAEVGEVAAAREVLARFDTPAFAVNRAYLDCLEHGRLAAGQLASIATPRRFDFHERSVLIGLGQLALDDRCSYPAEEFIALTDRWLAVPALAPHDQTLRHRAFALARLGDLEGAVNELERLQKRYPQLTEALYIAASWRLNAGDPERAAALFQRAQEATARLGLPVSALATAVGERLRAAGATQ
jgi:tetratricopeptide (TPR) repeat protein